MSVIVVNHVSLDGVMQGPGRADEDTRNGFLHGGWADGTEDPAVGRAMGAVMGERFTWLFGRRTYEGLLGHWNAVGGPFAEGLNAVPKHVASSDPSLELPWPNSTLISGDVPAAVDRLRAQDEGNLVIMGSGVLVHALFGHDLVDELLLIIHPLTLGGGRRLFPADDALRRFDLASAEPVTGGILLAHFRLSPTTTTDPTGERSDHGRTR